MNIILKYIIVKTGAILFAEATTHKQVAQGFDKVYSAGFYSKNIDTREEKVYGESESLKIKSHPEQDLMLIRDLDDIISKIRYNMVDVDELYNTIN